MTEAATKVQQPLTSEADATLGQRVRAARKALGLSQSQLAGAELTKGFISQLESGLVRPSIKSLQLIASRLGRSVDYFLADATIPAAKRIGYHLYAAVAAAESERWEDAEREAQTGLALEPSGRERATFMRVQAAAALEREDTKSAFDIVAEAVELLALPADADEMAELLFVRGNAYMTLGQLDAAAESFERSRSVLEKHEVLEPRLRARALVAAATCYRRLKRTAHAATTYERALAISTRTEETVLAARSYMGLAASLYDSGELDGAIVNYERALDLFVRASDARFELSALRSLADMHLEQGDLAEASALAERAIRRAEQVGEAGWAAAAQVVLASAALIGGRADEALRLGTEAAEILDPVKDGLHRGGALRVIGASREALGDRTGADEAYRAGIEAYRSLGHQAGLSGVAAEYAKVLRARGETDAAFDMLELARGSAAKA